jgi:chromosome segregation ATPase
MNVDDFANELVLLHAINLIAACADPENAKIRIERLVAATTEFVAQREAVEKAMAEAEPTRAEAERAAAELDERTKQFQTWTTDQEAKFRRREANIRNLEDLLANRQAELTAAEADLAKRVAQHNGELARLRERLAI